MRPFHPVTPLLVLLFALFCLRTGSGGAYAENLPANGTAVEEAERYLARRSGKPPGDYSPWKPPFPEEQPWPSIHAYEITHFNETIKKGLYEMLADDKLQEKWKDCLHHLGIWAALKPAADDFQRLRDAVVKIENSPMDMRQKVSALATGYRAIAKAGTAEAEDFLRARMSRDFWGEKMPEYTYEVSSSIGTHSDTAQMQAISAYTARGGEEEVRYLTELSKSPEIQRDPNLLKAIRGGIDLAPLNKRDLERDEAYLLSVRDGKQTRVNERPPTADSVLSRWRMGLLWVSLAIVVAFGITVYLYCRRA